MKWKSNMSRHRITGRMMRGRVSILIAVCILISNSPITATASTNGKTRDDAMAWANNHASKGSVIDYDGVSGAQCVDFIKSYYAYPENADVKGNEKDGILLAQYLGCVGCCSEINEEELK